MSYQFYRWFPGDYQRDTNHLGWYEDLAYRRLIDLYNVSGKPLRNDRSYLLRAIRASEPEQQAAMDTVLEEFFILKADGWHQLRCDAEIRHRTGKDAHAKRAANARWKRHSETKDIHAHAMQSHNQPEPEPEVLHLYPVEVPVVLGGVVRTTKSKGAKAPFVLPEWIPQEPWDAWVEMRKKLKKPATDWALKLAVMKLKNLQDRGEEATQVLMQSAFKGWTDLYPVGGAR